MWRIISPFILLMLVGCASQRQPAPPDRSPDIICWSKGSPAAGAEAWLAEARRRFPNPMILAGHGGERDGVWVTGTCADAWHGAISPVAMALHKAFPNRQIVIVACNPGGIRLHVPGVWYATRSVWSSPMPGDWNFSTADLQLHCYVGSIWEFEEGR